MARIGKLAMTESDWAKTKKHYVWEAISAAVIGVAGIVLPVLLYSDFAFPFIGNYFGLWVCGVPFFSLVGIIQAVKTWQYSVYRIRLAIVSLVLNVVAILLPIIYYWFVGILDAMSN
jgi:hypothetical protein